MPHKLVIALLRIRRTRNLRWPLVPATILMLPLRTRRKRSCTTGSWLWRLIAARLAEKAVLHKIKQLVFWENDPVFWENDPVFWEKDPVFWEKDPVFWEKDPIFWEKDEAAWFGLAEFVLDDNHVQDPFVKYRMVLIHFLHHVLERAGGILILADTAVDPFKELKDRLVELLTLNLLDQSTSILWGAELDGQRPTKLMEVMMASCHLGSQPATSSR